MLIDIFLDNCNDIYNVTIHVNDNKEPTENSENNMVDNNSVVNVNAGYNSVVLKYESPYLNLGFKVSIVSFSVVLVYFVADVTFIYIKKKKVKNK